MSRSKRKKGFCLERAKLTDECIPRGVKGTYDLSKDFTFQVLHWEAFDEGPVESPEGNNRCFNEYREHTIYMTGSTTKGNGVTLKTTFNPYFLLKLGRTDRSDRPWVDAEINMFLETQLLSKERALRHSDQYLREQPDAPLFEISTRYYQVISDPDNPDEDTRKESQVFLSYESAFCGFERVRLKDLDAGFTGIDPKRFQFIKLTFKTLAAMQACARRAKNREVTKELVRKGLSVAVYESNLDPHIRMMHLTQVEAAGWVKVPGGKYSFIDKKNSDRKTRSQIEIDLQDWRDLSPVNKEDIARFRQASFDLETYSPDDGKFSTPELLDNYILQIATTFTDFGKEDEEWRVLYNLKGIEPIDEPRTIVKSFDTEREMLLAWTRLIQNSDPDLVHAYNGWEFDYGYLAVRAKMCNCWEEFRNLGRLVDKPSDLIEKTLSSGAYGDNHWKLLPMSGRLVIDPMVHIKREFKLNFYNLKHVSEHFLSKKMEAHPFSITEGSRTVRARFKKHKFSVGQVVHFSGIDTPDVEEEKDKFYYALAGWTYEDLHGDNDPSSDRTGLHTVTRVVDENEFEFEMQRAATKTLTKAGGKGVKIFETKHDISFSDMFRAFREQDTVVMHKVGRYCIQDTLLPQKILDKLCVLPNLIEMAKATWVPMEYLITRGQQIKVFSQICKTAREEGWAVPTIDRKSTGDDNDEEEDAGGYTGGAVLEPFVGFFDDPIAVPDFKSLYPCTMIDGNYCYTSLVKNKKYLDIPGVNYNHVKVGDREHIFAMNYEGIVPKILVYLLNTRGKRKKMMADAKTPLETMIHNGAQLALKVSANSIYGFTGVKPEKAMLPCMAIAESTTAQGRRSTFTARDYAENPDNFRDIVQCDTHFPLNYPYLMLNCKKGKCFHLTAEKLLKMYQISLTETDKEGWRYLPLQEPSDVGDGDGDSGVLLVDGDRYGLGVWTTAEWSSVTGVSRVRRDYIDGDLIRIHTDKGATLDMQNFKARVLGEQRHRGHRDVPLKSTDVQDSDRNVNTAINMSKQNICTVVYGDTDSIFVMYDSSHLKHLGQAMRVAYCGIVAAFSADRITQHLRSLNPWKPAAEQWMELEYEKTYRFWILFSKKRYAGEMAEWDPFSFSEDKKGVALKRRDFCSFVKETYSKILKAIFNEDGSITRDQRIGDALEVVRKAVEDLLNNRVPFDKLIISKLLKDHYKLMEKKQKKQQKRAQIADFGPHNIFIDDKIEWDMRGARCKGIVVEKRGITASSFFNNNTAAMEKEEDTRPPLTVQITKVTPHHVGEEIPEGIRIKAKALISYTDVKVKGASVIHLSKILDPATKEESLEPVKFPHVRLARRMFLRDPATAPPSGSRVPYVFCEPDDPNVLQYLRAENPSFAQSHGLKVDPVYYLEKQCANAWGQILDTACPGLVESIFSEAYDRYHKYVNNQPELMAFLNGSYKKNMKQITLGRHSDEREDSSNNNNNNSNNNSNSQNRKRSRSKESSSTTTTKKLPHQNKQTTIGSFFAAPKRSLEVTTANSGNEKKTLLKRKKNE